MENWQHGFFLGDAQDITNSRVCLKSYEITPIITKYFKQLTYNIKYFSLMMWIVCASFLKNQFFIFRTRFPYPFIGEFGDRHLPEHDQSNSRGAWK